VAGAAPTSCAPPLPDCDDPAQIDVADVAAYLADPIVQRLLNEPQFVILGRPPFLYSLRRSDGHGFMIGLCSDDGAPCSAIPASVFSLESYLEALGQQQVESAACDVLAGPTFACGNSRCKTGLEYCASVVKSVVIKMFACRPYPVGCNDCGCALADAASFFTANSCGGPIQCANGRGAALQRSEGSSTLSTVCGAAD